MDQHEQTLAQFHFSREKSGLILRQWVKEAGLTRAQLEKITGIPKNTLDNSLYGKVQELTIDRTFKIATATGHCICEYIQLQLQDEHIAFADEVHVLREANLEKQKALPSATIVEKHHAKGESVPDQLLDRFKRIYEGTIAQLKDQIEQLKDSRTIMQEQYEHQIEAMARQHAEHNKSMSDNHSEAMSRADAQIERLEKQVGRLRTALIIETSAIGLLFFVDSLVGDRGWILRSLFHMGDGMTIIRRG